MQTSTPSFTPETLRVIIGLGNPGQQYVHTRHNIGFRIVDSLAETHTLHFQKRDIMLYAQNSLLLIKPLTFMNNSGDVLPFLTKKGIKPEHILVIHDELERKFGTVGIKWGGGARGHNGLRSIISRIGQNFWRMYVGIGRPADKADVPNYVLAPFDKQEEEQIPELLNKASVLLKW